MSVSTEETLADRDEPLGLPSGPYVAPRVNLLPPEVAERAALRRLQAGMLAGVVACAAVVGVLYYYSDSGRADAQDRLDRATTEGTVLNAQKQQLLPVQAQRQRIQQAKTALQNATATEVLWSQQLDLVRAHLSDEVGLKSFTVTSTTTGASTSTGAPATGGAATPTGTSPSAAPASSAPATGTGAAGAAGAGAPTSDSGPQGAIIATVAMSGVAGTPSDVANWLDTLDALPGWSDVYAQSVTRASDFDGYTFTLSADIDSTVLAKRYTAGG